MDLTKFELLRPVLYHLTDRRNVDSILGEGKLMSTEQITMLSKLAGRDRFLRTRRPVHAQIENGGTTYHIRDQKPFSVAIVKNALEKGLTVEDFLYILNTKVFFWAKITDLQSHFSRYEKAGEKPIIFRLNTAELFSINKAPQFCRLNSGGPRCNAYLGGKGVERGKSTFQIADEYIGTPSSVKEVTFHSECILPEILHIANRPEGSFRRV